MWARVVEVMLGCWLMMSPFIFRIPPEETFLWGNGFAAGAVMGAVALLACWPRAEKARLVNLAVCAYLVAVAFLVSDTSPPPPAYQNYIVVGLLLLVTAIIPTRTTLPPRSWQAFYENRQGSG